MNKKKICIIGGGVSGIISLKSTLGCDNLEPILFEKENGFGGVWNAEFGKCWNTIHTNISKYSCIFLDKPHYNIDETIDFPSRDQVYQYLLEYVHQFNLLPYMKLNHTIEKMELQESSKKWLVKVRDNTNSIKEFIFDHVIIATGIFSSPADYNESNSSSGKCIRDIVKKENLHHSVDYKGSEKFKGKDVLVIGNGSSGCDVATDLVNGGVKNLYHYFKKPFYIVSRVINNQSNRKVPFEVMFYSRAKQAASKLKTTVEHNTSTHKFFRMTCNEQQSIEHLKVTSDLTTPCFITINDKYIDMVKKSQIKIIKSPNEFILEYDKNNSDNLQVILCNGYNCELPFLERDVLEKLYFKEDDHLQPLILYKECWPSKLVPNLGFVGLYRGTYWGTLELQAIWLARVFSGKLAPPTYDQIEQGLKEELEIRNNIPRKQFPHSDVVYFTDSIAKELGFLPDFNELKQSDPELYSKLWDRTFLLYGYKLFDPNSNQQTRSQYLQYINDFLEKFPIK